MRNTVITEMAYRFVCFLALVSIAPSVTHADGPPNILLIYLDDFGWKDASYMGSDFYETPHLDELARGGMIFTSAYSCAANCAPARASLLSGQYSPRHEIYNVGTRPRGNAEHRRLQHVPGTNELRPDIVTWAELLQAAGYRTGMFGKWHLGGSPTDQGFDIAVDYRKIGFRGHRGPDGEYLADALTDHTIDFIRDNRDGPWCAYLAHFAVHTPLHPKKELLAKYEAKPPGELHHHVAMATMIQAVDDGVARLVATLKELELTDNTIIVFTSDNGGYGPATDMDPLWGYKGSYFEGGIREPLFVNWPGVIDAGQTSDEPVIGVDFFPTFAEIAGAEMPDQPLDGRSLVPLLKGEVDTLGQRPLYWHFPAYLQSYAAVHDEQRDPLFRTRPCSVVRLGDWKLHEYFEDGALLLFNLKDDIGEQRNLANENPEKRKQLHELLLAWREEIGAPVPATANPEYDADAEAQAILDARQSASDGSGR